MSDVTLCICALRCQDPDPVGLMLFALIYSQQTRAELVQAEFVQISENPLVDGTRIIS